MNSDVIEISDDAFKIVISFEIAGNTISIEKQSIKFKIDDKSIILKSTYEDELILNTKYLTIVVENYKNYKDAAIDMQKIDQSLKLTALDNHAGLINEYSSHDEHVLNTLVNNIENEKFPMQIIFKKPHSKGIYFNNAPFFNTEASSEIEKIKSSEFIDNFIKNYQYDMTTNIDNAITMLASIKFEYSSKVRLVLSMTVIEMLAEKNIKRSEEEIKIIDSLTNKIENSSLDSNQKKSLSQAISGCKYYSISNLCKKLIKNKLGKDRVNDFYELYKYRSQIVHSGKINDSFVFEENEKILSKEFSFAEKAYNLALDLLKKIK